MGMRETGAAIATNITYILNMVIADVCIRLKKDSWFPDMVFFYNMTVFNDICRYLKIGVPGMLMLCFEWWAFELLALFTGLLGVDQLAAEVVIINLISFIFMLPLGISYSASALTGNYIGEGKIDLAKKFAKMTVIFDIFCTTIIVILLYVFKDGVTQLFTKEPRVIAIFYDTMWVLLIYIWFDTIHGVQSGIIRGMGRQTYGSVYTLVCYYILGMPLALTLCFKHKMGIAGLWLGFSIACIILDIGFAMIISCPNWTLISNKIREDMKEGKVDQTPEVKHFRHSYTPKSNRTDQQRNQNEGGARILDLDKEGYEEPQFNKLKVTDDFAIGKAMPSLMKQQQHASRI